MQKPKQRRFPADAEIAPVASFRATESWSATGEFIYDRREHLGCGPHAPFHKKSSLAIARAGGKPQRIHNNCSGKHSGFLMLAQTLDAALESYLDFDSPGQLVVRQCVAELCGLEPAAIPVAVDGCGIHVALWGEEGDPGVVLVHGGAAHAHWWSFIAPQLARVGLEFQPWDFFMLVLFALTVTASLAGENLVKYAAMVESVDDAVGMIVGSSQLHASSV